MIFDNEQFGRTLALVNIVQTTEKDEFFYHEMIVHAPLLSHTNPKNILIIGGGDGGAIREILRHRLVKKVVIIEIDNDVVESCKLHLPQISQGAFDDPRLQLLIADGIEYVNTATEAFDIIICDSTDPAGPEKILFTQNFYSSCKKILNPGGIFVAQNGIPFSQQQEFIETHSNRKNCFAYAGFYFTAVPSYIGGVMAFGWASNDENISTINLDNIKHRLHNAELEQHLRYYTPEIHKASFAMPANLKKLLEQHY